MVVEKKASGEVLRRWPEGRVSPSGTACGPLPTTPTPLPLPLSGDSALVAKQAPGPGAVLSTLTPPRTPAQEDTDSLSSKIFSHRKNAEQQNQPRRK